MSVELKVVTGDGKYTIVQDHGHMWADRYTEKHWRNLDGDKLVYCLASDLIEARKLLEEARNEIASYHIDWDLYNNQSPDYDKDYKPKFPPIVEAIDKLIRNNI